MSKRSSKKEASEELSLSEALENLIEECRMILPGIQTLFGFQLIVVFNSTFTEKLDSSEQYLHLLAMTLVAIAIIIIMTPAAYHRQSRPLEVNQRFITISTRLLLWSMVPLALSLCVEFYLISHLILNGLLLPLLITLGLFALFIILWFVLPRLEALQRTLGSQR